MRQVHAACARPKLGRRARLRVREEMRAYVRGEQREGFLTALAGLAALGLAGWLVATAHPWRWAAAPLAPMGVLQLIAGANEFRFARKLRGELGVLLASDPGRFQHAEAARAGRALHGIRLGLALEAALLVVGAALMWFRWDDGVWSAIGLGLAADGLLLLLLDADDLRRTSTYLAHVRVFLTDVGARPTEAERGDVGHD